VAAEGVGHQVLADAADGAQARLARQLKGTAAALGVIEAVRAYHAGRGVTEGELGWVLEDNAAIQRIIEAVGGVPYKTYRVYEKAL
jgi:hypothetical protein